MTETEEGGAYPYDDASFTDYMNSKGEKTLTTELKAMITAAVDKVAKEVMKISEVVDMGSEVSAMAINNPEILSAILEETAYQGFDPCIIATIISEIEPNNRCRFIDIITMITIFLSRGTAIVNKTEKMPVLGSAKVKHLKTKYGLLPKVDSKKPSNKDITLARVAGAFPEATISILFSHKDKIDRPVSLHK